MVKAEISYIDELPENFPTEENLVVLATQLIEAKRSIEEIKTHEAIATKTFNVMREIIARKMVEQDCDSLRVNNGVVSPVDQSSVSIKNKARLLKWLKEHGHDDLITVQARSISSFVKNEILKEAGVSELNELPQNLLSDMGLESRPHIGIRVSTKAKG